MEDLKTPKECVVHYVTAGHFNILYCSLLMFFPTFLSTSSFCTLQMQVLTYTIKFL